MGKLGNEQIEVHVSFAIRGKRQTVGPASQKIQPLPPPGRGATMRAVMFSPDTNCSENPGTANGRLPGKGSDFFGQGLATRCASLPSAALY